MTTPAGWYEDPEHKGGQRYWDGHNWTDNRVLPAPPQPLEPLPGWYPDPEQPDCQRYWDGQQWTEDRVDYPAATELQDEDLDTPGVTKVRGWHGNVQFDGQMVTIHKTMHGEVTIPLHAINAVSIEHAGVAMWAIRFSVGGGTEAKRRKILGSYRDSSKDPYSLTFGKGHSLPKFKALVEEINRARFGG